MPFISFLAQMADLVRLAQTDFWDTGFALEILPTLLEGFQRTVYLALAAAAIALVAGLFIAVLRLSGVPVVSRFLAGASEFVRSTPVLVQLYFVFYVFPRYGLTISAEVTGIGVLGIHYATYLSEVYRAGIDAIPKGQWDASRALNLSRRRVWFGIILPQAIPPMLPAIGNYLNEMFKATPILLAITIIELLATAQQIGGRTFRYFEALTIAAALYLIVSVSASLLVQYAEKRFAASQA